MKETHFGKTLMEKGKSALSWSLGCPWWRWSLRGKYVHRKSWRMLKDYITTPPNCSEASSMFWLIERSDGRVVIVQDYNLEHLISSKWIVGFLILWESPCFIATQIKKIELKNRNMSIYLLKWYPIKIIFWFSTLSPHIT